MNTNTEENNSIKSITSPLSKVIRLPISKEEHEILIKEPNKFRKYIDEYYLKHPELFPKEMEKGYHLHGYTRVSAKTGLKFRRILIDPKNKATCYTICPSFIMPYMRGETEELEKMIFLSQFGMPYWALGYVFDKDPMFCYRSVVSMGNFSVTGTTVKSEDKLPENLVADEKHTRIKGEKAYIATTASNECLLGVQISKTADEIGIEEAYGVFKKETNNIDLEYAPKTVNTDGWLSTKKVWKKLFTTILVIECFLHAILAIRNVATKKTQPLFQEILNKAWNVYKASSLRSFSQRMRRLGEWADSIPEGKLKDKLLKLYHKKEFFVGYYSHTSAYRTSNMIDRLMDGMDRFIYSARYFHSNIHSANKLIRAYALIHNFAPSSPYIIKKYNGKLYPSERLNGFRYHNNWLHNLLISASRNGYRGCPHNPL